LLDSIPYIVANKIRAERIFMAQQAKSCLLASILMVAFLSVGCQVKTPLPCFRPSTAAPKSDPCPSEASLLETAQSIEKSLAVLASAQEAKSPPVVNTEPLITPEGGMGGTADIDWVGPLGPLVNQLAEMSNYRVKFLGMPPTIPIVVSITAKQTVIAELLQNASLQAGQRAKILVFPENRVIEVRYLN
jgi:defect-in-organelle-trafficking protein DotD